MLLERSLTFMIIVLVGLTAGLVGYSVAYDQLAKIRSEPKSITCSSSHQLPQTSTSGTIRP